MTYDLNNAQLVFDKAAKKLTVSETIGSDFLVRLEDTNTFQILDTAKLVGGDAFNLSLELYLVDGPGANNWTATGSLRFTDRNLATDAFVAAVQTTNIQKVGGTLVIEGDLGLFGSNTSILVNRGSPWRYVGDQAIVGEPDEDGVPGELTVMGVPGYRQGNLLTLKFGLNGITLDSLFSQDRTLAGGELKGQVVPAPGAVLLGMLGFGMVGWLKRRFA